MKYIYLLAIVLFISSCDKCKDEMVMDPCSNEGYELIDGSCQCPEDLFSAYGACRELREEEWYGITTGCPCEDTLFLRIGAVNTDGDARVFINENVFDISPDISPSVLAEYGRLSGTSYVDYFVLSEGDSINSGSLPFAPECHVGSNAAIDNPFIVGRFSIDRDTLFSKLIYSDGTNQTNVLDSCEVIFTR